MTSLELAAILFVAFIGFCSVCVLLVVIAASIIRRDRDEHYFRHELRLAQERELPKVTREQAALLCDVRKHATRHAMVLPTRRGDR